MVTETMIRICPRAMTIEWSDKREHWRWNEVEHCGNVIEEAELVSVTWFDCYIDMDASGFEPNIEYIVYLELFLKNNAKGWDRPVKRKIVMPDGTSKVIDESLKDKPKNEWFKMLIGSFKLRDSQRSGLIRFSVAQHDAFWITEAIIRSIIIEA